MLLARRNPSGFPLNAAALPDGIALVGPNADNGPNMQGVDCHGVPPFLVTPRDAFGSRLGAAAVAFEQGCAINSADTSGFGAAVAAAANASATVLVLGLAGILAVCVCSSAVKLCNSGRRRLQQLEAETLFVRAGKSAQELADDHSAGFEEQEEEEVVHDAAQAYSSVGPFQSFQKQQQQQGQQQQAQQGQQAQQAQAPADPAQDEWTQSHIELTPVPFTVTATQQAASLASPSAGRSGSARSWNASAASASAPREHVTK